jgi:putative two-component system response regulator
MAARIAHCHHERWDGTGYPRGLSGAAIPIEARITSVADVFDALSHSRPYKPAFSMDRCMAMLEEGRSRQFDPAVLDAMARRSDEIVEIAGTSA